MDAVPTGPHNLKSTALLADQRTLILGFAKHTACSVFRDIVRLLYCMAAAQSGIASGQCPTSQNTAARRRLPIMKNAQDLATLTAEPYQWQVATENHADLNQSWQPVMPAIEETLNP